MQLKNLNKSKFIQEEIKSRLKSGNTRYHSVQYLLFFSFLSKNLKIKVYRNLIFRVVLYGCETWSLTLREKRRMSVFENRVLSRIFGLNRDEVISKQRKLHNEEHYDLYSSPNIVQVIKLRRMRCAGHIPRMGGGDAHTPFWWGNLRERCSLEDLEEFEPTIPANERP